MDVAKRLMFDSMDLSGDATGLMGGGAPGAFGDLKRAHGELVAEGDQHLQRVMQHAQATADGGGANDLKRMQRQFQALKASYINIDMKQRFMQGLDATDAADLDVDRQTAATKQQEADLEAAAELLRDVKAATDQARGGAVAMIQEICRMQQQLQATTAANAAHLEEVQGLLREQAAAAAAAAARRPGDDAGPGQEECVSKNEQEAATARQLEDDTAAAQAAVDDLSSRKQALALELAALTAEVQQLEEEAAAQQQSQGATSQYDQACAWCSEMTRVLEQLSGVTLLQAANDAVALRITTRASASSSAAAAGPGTAAGVQSFSHELAVQMQPGSVCVAAAQLSPADVEVQDLLAEAQEQPAGQQLRSLVQGVRWRLQLHCQRECLLVPARAAGLVQVPGTEEPLWQAALAEEGGLPRQGEAVVKVPWAWPCPGTSLSLVRVTAPGLQQQQAEQLVERTNDDERLGQQPLDQFLQAVDDGVRRTLLQQQP